MTSVFRVAVGVFLILHGIAHLVGFVVPWRFVKAADVPYRTTLLGGSIDVGAGGIRAVGIVWLVLGMTVAGLGVAVLMDRMSYLPALWILSASLLLSIVGWPDARIGVAINIALLAVVLLVQK